MTTINEHVSRILTNERERCARVCDEMAKHHEKMAAICHEKDEKATLVHLAIASQLCAELIRIPPDAPLLQDKPKKEVA